MEQRAEGVHDAYGPDEDAQALLRGLLDEAYASGAHRNDAAPERPDARLPAAVSGVEPREELALVRVIEPGCAWSIHIEPARPDARYFKVSAGYGLYYRPDPGGEVDGTRAASIMSAVARCVEQLAARDVPAARIPHDVAAFIEQRADRLGIHAKTVAPRTRPHHLDVVAP